MPDHKADQVQQQQEQIRPRDRPVEVVLFDLAALGRHVELAELRVDQREQRRRGDVRRQHRFIHFGPERMAERALHARVGDARVHHVRQCVDRDRAGGGFDHVRAEKQIRQRRGEEHQTRDAVEEVHHRVQIAEPLADFQALAGERIVDPENLRHAARPANPLADVAGQAFGRETRRLRNREIRGGVAEAVQLQRGVRVFGDGLDRDAADLFDHGPAQQRARAAEEGGVPQIVAVLHEAVEQFAFVRHLAEGAEIAFERIGARRSGAAFAASTAACRAGTSRGRSAGTSGSECDRSRRSREIRPAVIFSASLMLPAFAWRLCVRIVQLTPTSSQNALNSGRRPSSSTWIADLVGRIVERERGEDGRLDHRERLVVGRDEDVDGRPKSREGGQRHRRALERPRGLKRAE